MATGNENLKDQDEKNIVDITVGDLGNLLTRVCEGDVKALKTVLEKYRDKRPLDPHVTLGIRDAIIAAATFAIRQRKVSNAQAVRELLYEHHLA